VCDYSFRHVFVTVPPPPTSTLFPYTTLFRSIRRNNWDDLHDHPFRTVTGFNEVLNDLETPHQLFSLEFRCSFGQLNAQISCDRLDRKSTRLNSSHVKISYAVFCLKKKTQTTN